MQFIISKSETDAAVKSVRLNRKAEIARTTVSSTDLINPIGTVSRIENRDNCRGIEPIPILVDGTLKIGLKSTHEGDKVGGVSAQVLLVRPNQETTLNIDVGESAIIQHGERKFNLSISYVQLAQQTIGFGRLLNKLSDYNKHFKMIRRVNAPHIFSGRYRY